MPLQKLSSRDNMIVDGQPLTRGKIAMPNTFERVHVEIQDTIGVLRENGQKLAERSNEPATSPEMKKRQDVEGERIRDATTFKKRVARTIGVGPTATEVVANAVHNKDATAESIADAIKYRAQVSHSRSELRHVVNRGVVVGSYVGLVKDATTVTLNLAAKAVGSQVRANTEQGDITRHLRQKAVYKAIDGAMSAAGNDQTKIDLVKRAANMAVDDINDKLRHKSRVSSDRPDPTHGQTGTDGNLPHTDQGKIAEIQRVKNATTPFKRLGRVVGLGKTATSIINEAVSSDTRTPESVAAAIDNKVKVSTRRSNLRHGVDRALNLAGNGYGILDVNRRLMGMPTHQGILSKKLAERAEDRAVESTKNAAGNDPEARDVVDRALHSRGLEARRRPVGRA